MRTPPTRCWSRFLKSDYTLTKLQGWNALGMRGTCSEGYMLKANAQADQVLPEPYEIIHSRTMVPSAHLLWGSVWTGIAASATRARPGLHPQCHAPQQRPAAPGRPAVHQGDVDAAHAARHALDARCASYQQVMDDPQAMAGLDFQTMITLTKVEASELAAATVHERHARLRPVRLPQRRRLHARAVTCATYCPRRS